MSKQERAWNIDRSAITPKECRAMRLLDRDGWTRAELEMTFQCGTNTVSRHVTKRCNHQHEKL